MYAYSSPAAFRAWDDATNLLPGEVYFEHAPTSVELTVAFPNYVAQPSSPAQVPMWAAQAALKQLGKYDSINTYILTLETSNPPVFFAWTMGNFASRASAFIAALAAQLDMSASDVDAVFALADQIATTAG